MSDKDKGGKRKAGKHSEQKQAEREEARAMEAQKAQERVPQEKPEEPLDKNRQEKKGTSGERHSGTIKEAMESGQFPVVGIGASAGGLEALETFFGEVPKDSGLAFVVVTHTDPDRASMLPELIKKKSTIPVRLIEDGMTAEPNTVYVPPSDRDPFLDDGVFHLKDRPGKPGLHMPVDLFLKHLAEDRGQLSACVILSGTGTDGTQGLRLVKEKAGFVIAQSEESARHAGMPKSAKQTGLVDAVLAPDEMPRRLIEYFKEPAVIGAKPQGGETAEGEPLSRILSFLASRTRHDFSLYKENTLVRRIERRMTITQSRNASDYVKLLRENTEEVRALFQDLLIGVTSFFRDSKAFSFLQKEVVPRLISQSEHKELRVWVPGCATGEEAYSVAIVVKECLEESEDFRDFQVFGTDIDPQAIDQARSGSYVQNIVTDVSPRRLERFFSKQDSTYRIKNEIREQIVFAEQNVLEDPPFSNVDLVVCRNLLIYLKPQAQDRLIPLFHYALRDSGVLFLGTSEGVGAHVRLFEPLSKQYSVYQKKDNVISPRVEFPTGTRKLQGEEVWPHPKESPETKHSLGQAAERVLMEEYTPPSVVVNEGGDILHFHGRTGIYLEPAPGSPTTQITDMARPGLRVPLLSALRRARDGEGDVRESNVQVKTNGEYKRIDLEVKSFNQSPLKGCRMVIFHERPDASEPEQKQAEPSPAEQEDGERTAELEQELMRVKEDYRSAMEELQTSNEELRSTNEEMQSSNEELQSTNEELESSREELQSLNEELNTVNSELHSKMGELKEAYEAISSVLNSTRIAIIFLDEALCVERFTPEAGNLLNLIESDVGRPFKHISHNLKYEDLSATANGVLKNLSSVNEEVQTNEGNWYRMRIMLYRPTENVIEGVVLTFINIDVEKRAQKRVEEMSARAVASAKRFARNIVDTVRESLLVLDSRMRVVTANRSFYATFKTDAGAIEGASLFELGNGQWDIPELKALLERVVSEDEAFEGYLVEHRFSEIGLKRMMLNARMLREEQKEKARILLAIEDVTEKSNTSEGVKD